MYYTQVPVMLFILNQKMVICQQINGWLMFFSLQYHIFGRIAFTRIWGLTAVAIIQVIKSIKYFENTKCFYKKKGYPRTCKNVTNKKFAHLSCVSPRKCKIPPPTRAIVMPIRENEMHRLFKYCYTLRNIITPPSKANLPIKHYASINCYR